jgi:hypothetical protein
MRDLESDPAFRRRRDDAERAAAERARLVEQAIGPVLEDLAGAGLRVDSIEDLLAHHAPLSPAVVRILLAWLPRVLHEQVQEMLIRALAAAREPFDGRALAILFDVTASHANKWAVANTMAEARPRDITGWLVARTQDPSSGSAREMLVLALARIAPRSISIPILLSMIEELPGHVADALAEVGGPDELTWLRRVCGQTRGWQRKAVQRAIRQIERRM